MENHDLIDDDYTDIFNENFETYEIDEISNLYKMREINDNNNDQNKLFPKIKEKKYNHPLLMNYNYCLFCLEKRKTKYYQKNLENSHYKIDINSLSSFFDIYQIKLKEFKNKNEKLAKRRIIHSFSPEKRDVNLNENKNSNHGYESDTELYIEKNKILLNKKDNHRNSFRRKYLSQGNLLKAKNDNKYIDVDNQKNTSLTKNSSGNINQEANSSREQECTITKKLSKHSNHLADFESENDENSIDIKVMRFKTTKDIKHYTCRSHGIRTNEKEGISNNDIIYIGNNQNSLVLSENHYGNFNPKIKSVRRDSNSIFAFIKNLFLPKKLLTKKDSLIINKEESHSPYIYNGDTSNAYIDYLQRNEKCEICLEDIKDKYTLVCGDFFCRECLRQQILYCMNDLAGFENIVCPNCKEPINENTISDLLNNDEYKKYNSIKMKIEYLYNKRLRPCPYPDCDAFGIIVNKDDKILICQNKHYFCGDCLEVINERNINNGHTCVNKYPETTNYLLNEKTIRKCPQCGTWVQREEGGCNYFRCTNNWCRYQFCWICGQKYDSSHYQNPLSMCFGLSRAKEGLNISSSKKCLMVRCIIIFLLIILVLLPIFLAFFSFVEMFLYTGIFVFDGKEVRFVDIKHRLLKKIFYAFLILFYVIMAMAMLSLGYISILIFIIIIPILVIYKKCKKHSQDF